MSELPWVRFFPSDWLGGTRGLSAAEAGVYVHLLANMYERGLPLVDDHARLARLCGASNSTFKSALSALIEGGKIIVKDGGLWNGRVEKELLYTAEKSEVGKTAADARWKKTKENQCKDDADAMQSQCNRNANQKPEAIIKEDTDVSSKKSVGFAELASVLDAEHAQAVLDHRRKIRKPLTAHAARLLAGKFAQTANPNGAADHMISSGWQGFEPEWANGKLQPAKHIKAGQYRIMRNGQVQHRNDADDDWFSVDTKASDVAAFALFDYRQPLEAVG